MYSKSSIYAHRKKGQKKSGVYLFDCFNYFACRGIGSGDLLGKDTGKTKRRAFCAGAAGEDVPKETPTAQPQPPEEQDNAAAVGKEEENKEEQKEEQEQQTSSQVTQTPVENTDVSALTSERILNSAALVPNAGFSVSDEYFDDAAFVGDSITEGIKLYEIMSNATVIAARGINLDNVFTDDQIRTAQGNTTVMGALEQANPKKSILCSAQTVWVGLPRNILPRFIPSLCRR